MSQWQPIETAPKDGTAILVYGVPVGEINDALTDGPVVGVAEWSYSGFDCPHADAYSVRWTATHWMPLPEAP